MDDLTLMWQSAPVRRGPGVGVVDRAEWFDAEVVSPGPESEILPEQRSSNPQPPLKLDIESEDSLEGLEARICSLAGRLATFTHDWLVLIAEFDRRKGWVQWGMKSCRASFLRATDPT